jgi:DNA-directed RNA polymerase specialized sigma24 family protein
MRVAYNAASSFSSSLSKDEIQSCILNALWRASDRFNKRQKAKFTSYLHNGVVYECLSQRKFNRSKQSQLLHENVEDSLDPSDRVDMVDLIEHECDDPSLVIDRFYNGMTIKELAEKRHVCGETIRVRLKKNLEKLRVSLTNGV